MILNFTIWIVLTMNALSAMAHPVIFKSGVDVSSFNMSMMGEQNVSYSFHQNFSVFVRYTDFRESQQEVYSAGLNTLAFRKNWRHAQSNIYLGLGGGRGQTRSISRWSSVISPMLEADYETRKMYLSGKVLGHYSSKWQDKTMAQLRAGMTPYQENFEGLHSWFIVQAMRIYGGTNRQWELTPLMRFFYNNTLWEVGASPRGQWLINLMLHL